MPVTGRGGLLGYGMSKLLHFVSSQLTDGSEVVSLTRRAGRPLPRVYFPDTFLSGADEIQDSYCS
jgi:hypothetical protein